MPTIEERLEAVVQTLELSARMQVRTDKVVSLLAEDQAKTERILSRIAILVRDHEDRLQRIENE